MKTATLSPRSSVRALLLFALSLGFLAPAARSQSLMINDMSTVWSFTKAPHGGALSLSGANIEPALGQSLAYNYTITEPDVPGGNSGHCAAMSFPSGLNVAAFNAISVWIKPDGTGRDFTIEFNVGDLGHNLWGKKFTMPVGDTRARTLVIPYTKLERPTWKDFSTYPKTFPTANIVEISLYVGGPLGGGTFYIDNIKVETRNFTDTNTGLFEDVNGTLVPVAGATATAVALSPATGSVDVGATTQLSPVFTPANASASLTWTSSNPAVSTVSTSGLVSGVAIGTTIIRASAGSFFGEATITVAAPSAPATPTTLAAAVFAASQINLSWVDNATNETGYKIERALAAAGPWTEIAASVAVGATSYSATGLVGSTAYWFRVRAANATGNSAYSNVVTATTPDGPSTAVDINSTTTPPTIDGTVDTAWSAASAAQPITFATGSVADVADLSGGWRALWDSANLYIVVDVTDDTKTNDSPNPWDDDSVEIYIDGGNNKTATYDANDRQYIFGHGDTTVVEGAGRNAAGITFAKTDPTATTYRLEIKIPWSAVGSTPAVGSSIGIDVQLNDDDNGGAREGKRAWKDGTDMAWGNPSLFGTGNLKNAGVVDPVPAAPSALTGTAGLSTAVSLTWVDSATNETGYKVEQATAAAGPWTEIAASQPANSTTFVADGLTPATTYFFRVRAFNASGNSGYSPVAQATTPSVGTPPQTPTNVSAAAVSATVIGIGWDFQTSVPNQPIVGVTFLVESGAGPSGPWTEILAVSNSLGVNVFNLTPEKQYWFRVRARDVFGTSGYSPVVSATTPSETAPTVPTNVRTEPRSSTEITVFWHGAGNATSTQIEIAPSATGPWAVASGSTISGLTPDTRYWFRVRQSNSVGTSPYSAPVPGFTLPPAGTTLINFYSGPKLPLGDGMGSLFVYHGGFGEDISKVITGISGFADSSGNFITAWDQQYLYVFVIARDDVLKNDSTEPWEDDSVEVFIDGGNERSGTYDANDREFVFGINDSSVVESGGRPTTGVVFASHISPDSPSGSVYRYEIRIPWSTVGVTPALGVTIGFDVHITDDDDGGLRDGQIAWKDGTDQAWRNPSAFGSARLFLRDVPQVPFLFASDVLPTSSSITFKIGTDRVASPTVRLERALSATGPWTVIESALPIISHADPTVGVETSYTATGLTSGTTYFFRALATNPLGDSAYSEVVSFSTLGGPPPPVPAAPSSLAGALVSPTEINLAWLDNATNETTYKVERALAAAGPWTEIAGNLPANTSSFSATGLTPNTAYWFRVRAANATGNSAYSAAITVTLPPLTIAVTGVSITPISATLSPGASTTLTAIVAPASASNKSVSWTTSNAAVATVSPSGVVTAVAAGMATITVTTADGSKAATSVITVSVPNVPVTGVSVTPVSSSVNVNATVALTATVAPANASNKSVSWTTSNAGVATVSPSGVVTGVSAGLATITVTTADGAKTAASMITVTAVSVPATGISVTPSAFSVNVAGTITLTATVVPATATNKAVTWSTSNTAVATVSMAGVVTGISVGTATITVTTQGGTNTASSVVTVVQPVVNTQRYEGENGKGSADSFVFIDESASGGEARGGIDALGAYVEWYNVPPSSGFTVATFAPLATSLAVLVDGVKKATLTIPAAADWNEIPLVLAIPAGATLRLQREVADGTIADIDYIDLATTGAHATTALKASSAISVNGALAESIWVLNNSVLRTVSGSNNNTVTFGTLWDANYLYIGVKVLDATIRTNRPNVVDNDSVEIHLDGNFNKGTTYDAADLRINKQANARTVWTSRPVPGLQHARTPITGGYTVEIGIPWSALGGLPAAGAKVGLDVQVNDNDFGRGATGQLIWNGDAANPTSTVNFGEVIISPDVAGVLLVP